MASLMVALLGPLQVTFDGQPLRGLAYDKVRALLAYLAVEAERPHRREALTGLLWPDQPERKARHSLRQALMTLRQALGDQTAMAPFLLISREVVQFNPAGDYELDVATFTALLAACNTHAHRQIEACPLCAQRLAQAITLYRGGFLDQFFLRDSAPFEEWALLRRERLHQHALQALTDLASYHERRGEYAQMQRYAQRQIELEPWNEAAHCQVMRALVQSGERGAALAQYERCRRILAGELGVEPEEATTALYQRIRDGTAAQGMKRAEESRAAPIYNLPAPPTPLIGRHDELIALAALLCDPGCRLVTIVGPPGIGKTRLSLAVAAHLHDEFEDGAVFVALAPIRDPNLIATTIAQPLGVKERANRPLLLSLKDELRDRRMLLVLDNFEQVLDAAPLVSELLAAAPDLTVLVTSRVPLHLAGEHEYAVPPLALPDRAHPPVLPRLTEYDAIRLFRARAQAVSSDFALTAANAPVVSEICHRLDGLPLAIELAAARVKLFTPQALLVRLDHRLNILTGGARDLPPRQQTLRGAIDWSYHLLGAEEQALFRRLGVFVGGWTLEAAEAICGDGGLEMSVSAFQPLIAYLPSTVLDGLTALVDQSLIKQEAGPDGEPRFTMLETICEYALERLESSGEIDLVRRLHAEYFLALAEAAEPHLRRHEQIEWLDRLEREHDNLQAALSWSLNRDAGEMATRLAVALYEFWNVRHVSEARRWFEEILSRADMIASTSLRAKVLLRAGRVSDSYAVQRTRFEEGLAISRALDDKRGIADALHLLGNVIARQGDCEGALPLYEESQAIYHELGDKAGVASTLVSQAHLAFLRGEYQHWAALNNESVVIKRDLGDKEGLGACLINLGEWARLQGDYERAEAYYEESLRIYQELGDKGGAAVDLINIGFVALHRGDYKRAAARFGESLVLSREINEKDLIGTCLGGLAAVAAAHGRFKRAARLSGAMNAIFATIAEQVTSHIARAELDAIDRAEYERAIVPARTQLGETAWEVADAEGRAMSLEQAIAEALRVDNGAAEA